MSAIDDLLKKHRKNIIDREEQTFRELLAAYREIEKELAKSYKNLQTDIEDAMEAGEEISPSWFFRQNRLKNLLQQVQKQIVRFGGEATKIIEREQRAAIDIAVKQAQETFDLEISQNRSGDVNLPDARNFASTLNPRTVETAVGMMGDGSPLIEYFEQQLAPMVADRIKSEVVKAAALGTDFKKIVRNLEQTGGVTLGRALTVARTEVNRVRRETARAVYKENDDIVEGWEWVASKSSRTCPLCLAMDGRQFSTREAFPQHINCRCTLKAVIIDLPARPRTLGKDWFETQPDEIKEKILGKEGFLACQEHGLTLDDFVAFRNDKRFGKSVTRKPLAKILADKGISGDGGKNKFTEINLPENIKVNYGYGTKKQIKEFFGKKISDNELGALVGAMSDAEVIVARDTENKDNLFFTINHPLILKQNRTLGLDYDNRLYFHNDYFESKKDAPKGTGLRSFTTQAFTAKKFGVAYIETHAAGYLGHSIFNGYYTWARMGYNAKLTREDKLKLPKKYENLKDLNELMTAGGAEDWKRQGSSRGMIFDLSDDATSWKILQNYLRERRFIVKF